jgi:hypothetical protein
LPSLKGWKNIDFPSLMASGRKRSLKNGSSLSNFDASLLHFSESLHHWRLLNIQRNNFVGNELHGHVTSDSSFVALNIFAAYTEGKGFLDY